MGCVIELVKVIIFFLLVWRPAALYSLCLLSNPPRSTSKKKCQPPVYPGWLAAFIENAAFHILQLTLWAPLPFGTDSLMCTIQVIFIVRVSYF
jgi:hypothetical protein